MPYNNLREFIAALEQAGELKRIGVEVDPKLEITEIADRVVKAGGPALLFEHAKGFNMPVLINAYGSRRRMRMALGAETISHITENYLALMDRGGGLTFMEKLKLLPKLKEIGDAFPREVKKAPCQEIVVEHPSFYDFPILTTWPKDGGPYITLPMVFSRDPDADRINCGMYRMQIYEERAAGMHWQIHKGGAHHERAARRKGLTRIPVSVTVGCDPVSVFASICPIPPDMDEMMFAGLLRGKPIEVVRCKTNDLLVPAQAEIVFEGYVDFEDMRLEGPFGDHTGFYSLADMYPTFHLTCVTHRRDPIYMATVVGRPPMEDCYMGEAVGDLFTPLMKKILPEIEDMHMPFEGVFHNMMLVSMRKEYPGHARKVMHAIWGMGQAMTTKVIVVVDAGTDLRNYSEVVWKVLNHIDPQRDMEFVLGPVDTLDHASRLPNYGSKVGIDATSKNGEEGFTRDWPDEMVMDESVKKRVDEIWKTLNIRG
ncbi:menaquinone biosynthesis decarboxylase [Candidatus Sumerlaeota bacterium]|nr:menaquinone biosynthesis decarboxylase [Candidatus Sumerlaeota bacterium]